MMFAPPVDDYSLIEQETIKKISDYMDNARVFIKGYIEQLGIMDPIFADALSQRLPNITNIVSASNMFALVKQGFDHIFYFDIVESLDMEHKNYLHDIGRNLEGIADDLRSARYAEIRHLDFSQDLAAAAQKIYDCVQSMASHSEYFVDAALVRPPLPLA